MYTHFLHCASIFPDNVVKVFSCIEPRDEVVDIHSRLYGVGADDIKIVSFDGKSDSIKYVMNRFNTIHYGFYEVVLDKGFDGVFENIFNDSLKLDETIKSLIPDSDETVDADEKCMRCNIPVPECLCDFDFSNNPTSSFVVTEILEPDHAVVDDPLKCSQNNTPHIKEIYSTNRVGNNTPATSRLNVSVVKCKCRNVMEADSILQTSPPQTKMICKKCNYSKTIRQQDDDWDKCSVISDVTHSSESLNVEQMFKMPQGIADQFIFGLEKNVGSVDDDCGILGESIKPKDLVEKPMRSLEDVIRERAAIYDDLKYDESQSYSIYATDTIEEDVDVDVTEPSYKNVAYCVADHISQKCVVWFSDDGRVELLVKYPYLNEYSISCKLNLPDDDEAIGLMKVKLKKCSNINLSSLSKMVNEVFSFLDNTEVQYECLSAETNNMSMFHQTMSAQSMRPAMSTSIQLPQQSQDGTRKTLVKNYLDECIDRKINSKIPSSELYDGFVDYSIKTGQGASAQCSNKVFTPLVKKCGFKNKRFSQGVYWLDVGFKK